jgi:hypothetical protein
MNHWYVSQFKAPSKNIRVIRIQICYLVQFCLFHIEEKTLVRCIVQSWKEVILRCIIIWSYISDIGLWIAFWHNTSVNYEFKVKSVNKKWDWIMIWKINLKLNHLSINCHILLNWGNQTLIRTVVTILTLLQ